MVIDPISANGAYMISGGGNGGLIEIIKNGLIPALIDLLKVHPVAGAAIAFLYTMITSLDAMQACIASGNYVALAAFLVMTLIFIVWITFLITMAISSGIGLIFMGIFATEMELMYSDMNTGILETC